MRQGRSYLPLAVLVLLLLAPARSTAEAPSASLSVTEFWQDNATNATAGDGILASFTSETAARLEWPRAVDFSTFVSGGLVATVDACTTFSGLDSATLAPRVGLRRKLGVGPYVPVLTAALQVEGTVYRDAERSHCGTELSAGWSQRFTDALQLVIDGKAGVYAARHTVFSGTYTSLNAALNWDADQRWRFKLLGGWRDGAIVANYRAAAAAGGYEASDPDASTYGGPHQYVATFGEPYIAYRARAQTRSYGAGVSPAVGPNTSLVVQYVRSVTNAYDRYVNDLVSASVVHHF